MRRRPHRTAALFALILALSLAGPLTWVALADDPPPSGDAAPSAPNVVDPGVSDGLTGGALPSLPVPANPVPGSLPAVPTELDPQDTEDVSDGPVTITLSGNASGTLVVDGRDVQGRATGLNPAYRYISLFYGSMSTSRPGEALTCADVRTAAFNGSWTVRGEWQVADDGTATLDGTAPRDLADGVYTASIRRVPSTAGSDPQVGFNPVQYPVVACGAVPSP